MFGNQKYVKFIRITGLWFAILLWPVVLHAQADLPDIPDLIRVTVDHADEGVLIQWEPSFDKDIQFYHVYKMNAGQAFERLISFPPGIFEYKHLSSGLKNLAYSVTAEDSAGNESLFGQNVHRAVSLSVTFDPCSRSNLINWTPYEGWEGNISGYRIYGGPEDGSFQLLQFVPPNVTTYTDGGIAPGTIHNYYIETVHTSGIISQSAVESVEGLFPDAPEYLTMDFVTVLDDHTIQIQFSADLSGPVQSFRLLKRENTDTPFKELTTFWNMNQPTLVFEDQVPTASSSVQYMVQSFVLPQSCTDPIVISESNTGNNVLLQHSMEGHTVILNWSPYREFESGLAGYRIEKKSGNGEFYEVQTVGSGSTRWQESIQPEFNGLQPGELEYRIQALSNEGDTGEVWSSYSNIIRVKVETHIRIPTAFTPGSNDMNAEFRPGFDFAPKEYTMIVVDRGGRRMFETTDPGEGWDGRFRNGAFVNEGVYVYYIQFTDHTGLFRSYTGNITVLYPLNH